MAASSFSMLAFLFFPLAGSSNDLLSLIDAGDYFKSRQIDAKIDPLIELASKKPEGSADRTAQLLAIRWLGEHSEETKKSARGRDVLQQIADGKLGQEPLGFARDYARRALARLDGKPLPLPVIGNDSLPTEALAWMPDGVSFFYAVDTRTRLKEPVLADEAIVSMVRTMIPQRSREEIYNFADTVGNLRLDRLSLGMTLSATGEPQSIYVHCNGLGDRELLAKYLLVQQRNTVRSEEKGPKGEPITLLQAEHSPGMALVGNSDFIVAGQARPKNDNLTFVREMFDVRAGKKANAGKGSLAAILKEAPAGASLLMGGAMPDEVSRMLLQPRGPFTAFPKESLLSVVIDRDIQVRLHGKFANADDAKGLAETIALLKQQAQAALKRPGLPLNDEAIAVLQKSLDSIKTETNGDKVQVSAQAGADAIRIMLQTADKLLKPQRLPGDFD